MWGRWLNCKRGRSGWWWWSSFGWSYLWEFRWDRQDSMVRNARCEEFDILYSVLCAFDLWLGKYMYIYMCIHWYIYINIYVVSLTASTMIFNNSKLDPMRHTTSRVLRKGLFNLLCTKCIYLYVNVNWIRFAMCIWFNLKLTPSAIRTRKHHVGCQIFVLCRFDLILHQTRNTHLLHI